jgi:Zn-dependent protease/CBS domain-containing protein
MEASIRLATIRNIPVGVHYSWFIVFFGFSALLATSQYPNLWPGWTTLQYWSVAVLSVLLLFFSVLLHEFGHAITAQRLGIPVVNITLFIFGGVATISKEAESAGDEFKIAIAGPIVSVLTGLSFGSLWVILGDWNEQVSALLGYIAIVNFILAIFNMIPGFPLDGGRVLRAILWKATGSQRTSTRIVSVIGTLCGMGLFALGIAMILMGNPINGIYMLAIGWFLQNAASQGRRLVEEEDWFAGVTAVNLMQHQPITVSPDVPIQAVVSHYILGQNVRGLPVCSGDRLVGIITLSDIKPVPSDRWPSLTVADLMTPAANLHTVTESTPVAEILRMMALHDLHQMPVMRGSQLVGLVSRSDLLRFMQMRQELGGR